MQTTTADLTTRYEVAVCKALTLTVETFKDGTLRVSMSAEGERGRCEDCMQRMFTNAPILCINFGDVWADKEVKIDTVPAEESHEQPCQHAALLAARDLYKACVYGKSYGREASLLEIAADALDYHGYNEMHDELHVKDGLEQRAVQKTREFIGDVFDE